MRPVILVFYYMPNGLASKILKKYIAKFSEMSGKDEKIIREKFHTQILNSGRENLRKSYSKDLMKRL